MIFFFFFVGSYPQQQAPLPSRPPAPKTEDVRLIVTPWNPPYMDTLGTQKECPGWTRGALISGVILLLGGANQNVEDVP